MASAAAGNYSAGNTITLTLYASEAVTVSGHADVDAQRWRHRDLQRRLRHQCIDLQLHGGERAEYFCAGGDGGQRHDYRS